MPAKSGSTLSRFLARILKNPLARACRTGRHDLYSIADLHVFQREGNHSGGTAFGREQHYALSEGASRQCLQFALAKLHAAAGRKNEALASAEAAAGYHSQEGVEILADWYRTGSGPVERDLGKAKT